MSRLVCALAFGVVVFTVVGGETTALGQSVDPGGRMYLDYFYNVAGPDSASTPGVREGLHGFRYRRLYLTTDFTLSEAFSGRARLEADEGTNGRPVVKDLSLTWAYAGAHSATLGITPPPAFGIAEDVWGYRSLEKTILDVQGVVSSRDFGLRFDGPITTDGTVRYAAMIANNGTVRPEPDPYKRVYGQVEVRPSEALRIVVGADHAGYGDERTSGTRLSGFVGYSTDQFRAGIEGYWYRVAMAEGDPRNDVGVSFFGGVQVASNWELVARLDRSREAAAGPNRYVTFFLGAVSYQPHPNVRLMPNVHLYDRSDAPVETTARGTVEVNF
jgi:hypothetical protein